MLNEIDSIWSFIEHILTQTRHPNEFIIVDGGSKDWTYEFLLEQQEKWILKVFRVPGNIALARNFAISKAKNDIILCTDAGCIVSNNWAEQLMKEFLNNDIKVVWGPYFALAETDFQKKLIYNFSIQENTVENFNPSSRNIAFRKEVWEKVWGYPEYLSFAGEDTFFNESIKMAWYKIYYCEGAKVYWEVRKNFKSCLKMFFNYTRGDTEIFIIHWHLQNKNIHIAIVFICLIVVALGLAFVAPGILVILSFVFLILLGFFPKTGWWPMFTFSFNIIRFWWIITWFLSWIKSGILIKKRIKKIWKV